MNKEPDPAKQFAEYVRKRYEYARARSHEFNVHRVKPLDRAQLMDEARTAWIVRAFLHKLGWIKV